MNSPMVPITDYLWLQEIEELIDEWTPEPLVADQTLIEEIENEKLPIIVGYVHAV